MSEIDLGVKAKDKYDIGGMLPASDSNGKVYPHFHYCGPTELDLPDEGEMTIRFCKRSETSEIEEDGSHWYECKIEVKKILQVNGEDTEVSAPAISHSEAADALDRIASELEKLKAHEAEGMKKEDGGEDEDNEGY